MTEPSILGWEEDTGKVLLHAIDRHDSTANILKIIAENPLAARSEKSENCGIVPLQAAIVKRCAPEVVEALLKCWPEGIHERFTYDNKTCLHLAVSRWRQRTLDNVEPNPRVVKMLLEADPTAASAFDLEGSLPLHAAADNAPLSLEVAKLLVDAYPEGVKTQKRPCWGSAEYYPLQIVFNMRSSLQPQDDVVEYLTSLFPEAATMPIPEPDIGSYDR